MIATVASIAAGIAIAVAPDSVLFAHHTAAIEERFFQGQMPADARELRAFLFGPLGGTIAGYFVMQLMIVLGPFRRRRMWAWHAIFWPLVIWFVIDSTMSIYHGAFFNVWMINLGTLLMVGIPLAATHRTFAQKRGAATSKELGR